MPKNKGDVIIDQYGNVTNVSKKKLSSRQQIEKYDAKFSQTTFWVITVLVTLLSIGVGIAFQLKIWFLLIVAACCAYVTPKFILYFYTNKYEEAKFQDITGYIEQMLYSFRRNSKILNSLQDTLAMFPDGEMHDTIQEAINYIISNSTSGNIYEEALDIIGKKYNCRRVKSLHRYLVKVEGVGGNHDMGVSALIDDRRMWVERIDAFKKEKSATILDIIVATIFSSIIIIITLYMLPSEYGAATHIVTQVASSLYILLSLLNIKATVSRLVLYLNDNDNEDREKYLLRKLEWYKTFNLKKERAKALGPSLILIVLAALCTFLWLTGSAGNNMWLFAIIAGVLALFALFAQPILKYKSTKKMLVSEIEKVFPDWLLELSLLLQTDNLHVALEKTIDDAPLVLSRELRELSDQIAESPNALDPYIHFLDFLPLPNVHSSMKLLYSISEFGAQDEQKQIQELIERNSILMSKAEEAKNQDRISRVFMLKFVPMGLSVLKMIVDMAVFMLTFLGGALGGLGM